VPANEKKQHPLSFYLAWLLIGEVVFMSLFLPVEWYQHVITAEWKSVTLGMGEKAAEQAHVTGERWYREFFVQSGISDSVYNFFIPSEEPKAASKGLDISLGGSWWFTTAKARIRVFFSMVLEICVRCAIIGQWIPFFVAVAVPCMWDGLMQWRKKQFSFKNASPIVHGWALKLIHHYPFAAIFLVIAPIPLPALILPVMAVISGYALFLISAHTQKRL
jgi:hypothetical protein